MFFLVFSCAGAKNSLKEGKNIIVSNNTESLIYLKFYNISNSEKALAQLEKGRAQAFFVEFENIQVSLHKDFEPTSEERLFFASCKEEAEDDDFCESKKKLEKDKVYLITLVESEDDDVISGMLDFDVLPIEEEDKSLSQAYAKIP